MPTLPHSGLTVPHTDYRVTSLKQHNTHDGVAYNATLRKGKTIIGTVENGGTGGPDMFYPSTANGYKVELPLLEAFAKECRNDRGEPTDLEFVLSDLVTEYDTERQLKKAAKNNYTMLRLREDFLRGDDDKPMGWPSTTMSTMAPAEWPADRLLRECSTGDLAPHDLAWWQRWDTTAAQWTDVTTRPAHLLTEATA